MAFNISPDTIVLEDPDPQTTVSIVYNYHTGQDPSKDRSVSFVKSEVRPGIFPELCTKLLNLRKTFAKTDPSYKTLKNILTKVYGTLGA